ncbi:hypothetical protein Slin15195_G121320 [Septoria linicola]|uniref:Uncharacterized protein n=1 Tax=Septoria linicola TaxID=215465 RepID=A0A9Q9B7G8_9PEZI|nr:hypothetical protein Slin14017_G098330 [Septoria linicola]USW58813.1 hypothetical protein Slin15195_G121320 [Septoria linicola]
MPSHDRAAADNLPAEFRGPGMHHRFDDSPDDYDMDMDQRTRMLGHGDNDNDVDMEDRVTEVEEVSEEADDEAVQRNQQKSNEDRTQREGTPAPAGAASGNDISQKVEDSKQRSAVQPGVTPDKILPVVDNTPSQGSKEDEKTK